MKLALALSWDGARLPIRMLPPRARAFLRSAANKVPPAKTVTQLFLNGHVSELRICWVPRLKGGDANLCAPFQTADQKRMAFTPIKTAHFGDILGVVYRPERTRSPHD